MARVTTPVNRSLLEESIRSAEENGGLRTRDELHKKVTEIYNSKSKINITHSIVMLRIKEWNISCKTEKGRKGPQPGTVTKPTEEQLQKMREGRKEKAKKPKADLSTPVPGMADRFRDIPEKYHPLKIKAEKSIRAAIKLNCLDCVGFEPVQKDRNGNKIHLIRECGLRCCAMWTHRPFQKEKENKEGINA